MSLLEDEKALYNVKFEKAKEIAAEFVIRFEALYRKLRNLGYADEKKRKRAFLSAVTEVYPAIKVQERVGPGGLSYAQLTNIFHEEYAADGKAKWALENCEKISNKRGGAGSAMTAAMRSKMGNEKTRKSETCYHCG